MYRDDCHWYPNDFSGKRYWSPFACEFHYAFGDKIQDKGKNISKYWKILGYMGLLGAFGIMAYYMVLGGWVMSYIISLMNNTLDISAPITKEVAKDFYDLHISNSPWEIMLYTFLFVAVNYIILAKGIIGGIERSVKYLMPCSLFS